MKKLISLCLLFITSTLQAQTRTTPVLEPDPCKSDVACQYKALDERAKKEKAIQEEKAEKYRQEMLETQQAQLEETQKQNELIEEGIEVQEAHSNVKDRQMEQEDPIEYQNEDLEASESEEVLK